MTERQITIVYQENGGQRLDKFLASQLPELSRSRIQNLIKDGLVMVDGKTPHKAGLLLEGKEEIQVTIPESQSTDLIPEDIPLDIVFENDDVIVVNKPAGMVVHPAAGHFRGTLVHAALAHAPEMEGIGGEQRPGIVHRLDKDTSGLILLAKNDQAHRWLQKKFQDREVDKTYLALLDGQPPTPSGRVEAPIGRDPRNRKTMAVSTPKKGRDAVTEYRTRERFPHHTLIEAHPITGRTHQIRIHMAFLDCPIVGDLVYGRRKSTLAINRHFLHAWRLTIALPGEKQPRTFFANMPPELENILQQLRQIE